MKQEDLRKAKKEMKLAYKHAPSLGEDLSDVDCLIECALNLINEAFEKGKEKGINEMNQRIINAHFGIDQE